MKVHASHIQTVQRTPNVHEELGIIDMFHESDLVLATLVAPEGVALYLTMWESGVSSVDVEPAHDVYRKQKGRFDTTGFQYIRYIRILVDSVTEKILKDTYGENLDVEWALIVKESEPNSIYLGRVVGNKIIPTDVKVRSVQRKDIKGLMSGVSEKTVAIHFS